jgi:acetyl-CoA synthetase
VSVIGRLSFRVGRGRYVREARRETAVGADAVAENYVYSACSPKGIVHTTGGYLTGVAATHRQVFDHEGAPDYPHKGVWWELCERQGVTIFYTAPTAIRACMKWGPEHPAAHDLSALRLLGTVGEPINPKAWLWYHEVIGGGR